MINLSATAGTALSKNHAASAKTAAHQTTGLGQTVKTNAARTPTAASSANEEPTKSSSQRFAESVKAGRSKQLSHSGSSRLATAGKLLNKLV